MFYPDGRGRSGLGAGWGGGVGCAPPSVPRRPWVSGWGPRTAGPVATRRLSVRTGAHRRACRTGPRPLHHDVTQQVAARALAHGLNHREEPGGGRLTGGGVTAMCLIPREDLTGEQTAGRGGLGPDVPCASPPSDPAALGGCPSGVSGRLSRALGLCTHGLVQSTACVRAGPASLPSSFPVLPSCTLCLWQVALPTSLLPRAVPATPALT